METRDEILKEVLNDIDQVLTNPEIVMDNKKHYVCGETCYEVRMPTRKQLSQANIVRNQKFIELINQPNAMTTKQLIEKLNQNMNNIINDLDKKIKDIETQVKDVAVSLAKQKDSSHNNIEKLKAKIKKLELEHQKIALEKIELLSSSVENQAQESYYEFLTVECTHTLDVEKDDYKKTWKSKEEWDQDQSKLPLLALGQLTQLMMGV